MILQYYLIWFSNAAPIKNKISDNDLKHAHIPVKKLDVFYLQMRAVDMLKVQQRGNGSLKLDEEVD
jgi:hypothetical protein